MSCCLTCKSSRSDYILFGINIKKYLPQLIVFRVFPEGDWYIWTIVSTQNEAYRPVLKKIMQIYNRSVPRITFHTGQKLTLNCYICSLWESTQSVHWRSVFTIRVPVHVWCVTVGRQLAGGNISRCYLRQLAGMSWHAHLELALHQLIPPFLIGQLLWVGMSWRCRNSSLPF